MGLGHLSRMVAIKHANKSNRRLLFGEAASTTLTRNLGEIPFIKYYFSLFGLVMRKQNVKRKALIISTRLVRHVRSR